MAVPDVLTEVRKRRGPFTRIVIGLVIAWLVLGVVRGVVAVLAGLHVLEAFRRHGGDLVSVPVLLVLLLFVVADVWVRPRLANARSLARAATWVASAAVALEIAARAVGLGDPLLGGADRALGVADLVISSVVPVLLCVALATVTKAAQRAEVQSAPETGAGMAGTGIEMQGRAPVDRSEAAHAEGTEARSGMEAQGEAGREGEPTWHPDAAAGAAWTTAADAARGGGAISWGDERDAFGWQPPAASEGQDDAPTPPRTTAGQLDRGLWEPAPRDQD